MRGTMNRERFNILFFVFASSLLCGTVFLGVLSSLAFMLSEKGFSASVISSILLATLPYSFKFILSPIVKNIIEKHNIKIVAYISQLLTMIGLSTLGLYSHSSSKLVIFTNVFVLVLFSAFHDLIGDHVRLSCFHGRLVGFATSVGTIGFRMGMLISGAGMLYMADIFSWKIAFLIAAMFTLLSTISLTMLPEIAKMNNNKQSMSLKSYSKFLLDLPKKYYIFAILVLTFSFKFSDSCVNTLKSVFFQVHGLSKIDYANISQIMGTIIIVIAGIIAGGITYKFNIKKCIQISFCAQIISSACFIVLSYFEVSILVLTILVNISSFFFGFSSVVYRVYISEISMSDINMYTILLSIGSVGRTFSAYIGGTIADACSWQILYIVCLLSNIPGILICFSRNINESEKIFSQK
jgi:PAT family beta-lactamase induction signal transducer AmpG